MDTACLVVVGRGLERVEAAVRVNDMSNDQRVRSPHDGPLAAIGTSL